MAKHVIVLPDGTEISSGRGTVNAIQNVLFSENTNSGTELTIGSICASSFEAQIISPGGAIAIQEGTEMTVFTEDARGNREKVGLFTTEKPTRTSANMYRVQSYDRITWLDKDLTDWINGLSEWPYSLRDFAVMVLAECGLNLKNTEVLNGNYPVQKFNASGVTGRALMQKIGEACCRFGRVTVDGEFEFAWYRTTNKRITSRDYVRSSLSYEDYATHPIEKVQIKQTESDVGVIWPNLTEATNSYVITGNYLLASESTEDLQPVAQAIYEELSAISYTPCKLSVWAPSGIRAGDIVSVTDINGRSFTTCIMCRERSGQREILRSVGSYRRDSVTQVNNQTFASIAIGKLLELQKGIEGLSIKAVDLQAEIDGLSEETAQKITEVTVAAEGISAQVQAVIGDFENYKEQVSTELEMLADGVTISVTKNISEQLTDGDNNLQEQINAITTNYRFTADGQYIGRTDDEAILQLAAGVLNVLVAGHAMATFDRTGVNVDQVTVKKIHMGNFTLSVSADWDHIALG